MKEDVAIVRSPAIVWMMDSSCVVNVTITCGLTQFHVMTGRKDLKSGDTLRSDEKRFSRTAVRFPKMYYQFADKQRGSTPFSLAGCACTPAPTLAQAHKSS